jgi:AcrR family transcriptional regulator
MNRRERKKEETRVNIINCAVDSFKAKGFEETSMEEIAEKADVSKGTLYNYFPDKDSILVGYFQQIIREYGKELQTQLNEEKIFRTRLFDLLDFINKIFSKDMELAVIYFRYRMQNLFNNNPFDNPQRSGLDSYVLEIIALGQKNKELRSDISPVIIARSFQFLLMSFFIANLYIKEPFDMGKQKNQLVEIFMNGAKIVKIKG